jgi:hypothetical protein
VEGVALFIRKNLDRFAKGEPVLSEVRAFPAAEGENS